MPASAPRACWRSVYDRHVAVLWQRLGAGFILAKLALIAVLMASGAAGWAPVAQAQAAAPSHITARLVAEAPLAPGAPATLALHMTPAPGWHGYWLNPGDAGFAMRLTWHLPAGASVGEPRYPVPQTLLVAGLMNHVFEQDYAVLAELRLPAGVKAGNTLPIGVSAQWLACSATVCVPEQAVLATTLTLPPGGAAPDPRFDQWRARLPAPLGATAHFAVTPQRLSLAIPLPARMLTGTTLSAPHVFVATDAAVDPAASQTFLRHGDTLVVHLARAKLPGPIPTAISAVLRMNAAGDGLSIAASPGPVPIGGVALDAASPHLASLPLLLLAALAGGLLLNVMPCVFPILSLKALSLARAGESEAEARAEGLAYSAGVILACTALGGLLLALRAGGHQLGWAFQLQEPGVVVALLLLACAITANLAGMYEFAVPGFVQGGLGGNGGVSGRRGAFATGLLAAFVATPCTGPFMAGAMGAALLLPTLAGLALFAALGLGLALPFLGIACVPPLRRLLPRPGAWMVWFRRAMALPLGLTALALVWLAGRLGGESFATGAGMLALVLVAALAWVGAGQRRGLAVTARVGAVALVLAGVAVLALPRAYHPAAPADADLAEVLPSQPFSQAALDAARASGHPVFAFFTADWCLTCKVNEEVAIERQSTRTAFARAGVVVLKGDWTRRDPAITRYLNAMGAGGVPLYVWYPAGGAAVQLPQILTPALLAGLPAGQTRRSEAPSGGR